MSISPQALFTYLKSLLQKEKIKDTILKARTNAPFRFVFKVVPSCGLRFGGLAFSYRLIQVSSWILKDASVAKGVVRHELAHVLHDYADTGGTAHGKEFIQMLKLVSPNRWRADRYWQMKPTIIKARNLMHPKGGLKVNPLTKHNSFNFAY